MALDDLSAPLGKRKLKPSVGAAQKYLKYAPYGVLGIIVLFIGLWPVVVNDPNGGEPVGKLAVEVPKYTQKPAGSVTVEDPKKQTQIMNGTALIRKIEQPKIDQQSQTDSKIIDGSNSNNEGVVVTDPSTGQIVSGNGAIDTQNLDQPLDPNGIKLRPAPDPRLVEKTPTGLLPMVGNDGSKAYKIYARPSGEVKNNGKTVRVAIFVGGLGLSVSSTDNAVTKLPAQVSLGFAPYGTHLQTQVNKARVNGHEIMLQVPMEPFDYPSSDPGPQTLLTVLSVQQNQERLRWFMSRYSGYIGITNYMGGKFTAQDNLLKPILQEIRDRGLMYVDDGSSSRSRALSLATDLKAPFAKADVVIDKQPSPEQIDARLNELEAIAYRQGYAIGTATALPISVDMITEWTKSLERRGIILVPISAFSGTATDKKE